MKYKISISNVHITLTVPFFFFFLACTTSKLFEYSLKEEIFLSRISSELPSVKILPFKSRDYIVIILPC